MGRGPDRRDRELRARHPRVGHPHRGGAGRGAPRGGRICAGAGPALGRLAGGERARCSVGSSGRFGCRPSSGWRTPTSSMPAWPTSRPTAGERGWRRRSAAPRATAGSATSGATCWWPRLRRCDVRGRGQALGPRRARAHRGRGRWTLHRPGRLRARSGPSALATNGRLHDELLEVLARA